MIVRCIYSLVVALVLSGPGWSAGAEDMLARYYAQQYLSGLGAEHYTLTPIEDSYVAATFPTIAFFAVVFQQYPVMVEPPEGLNPSDIIVVLDDKVIALTGPDDLKVFYQAVLAPVADVDAAENAGRTWLRLTEVFSQDGFFTFSDPVVGVIKGQAAGEIVLGTITVTEGGRGWIHMAMDFDADGQLIDVMEVREVHAGVRPI